MLMRMLNPTHSLTHSLFTSEVIMSSVIRFRDVDPSQVYKSNLGLIALNDT